MQLGEIQIIKNESKNILDGEVIILCPGYNNNDVIVNRNKENVTVIFNRNEICNSDHVKVFLANGDYDFDIAYNIKDGVFILQTFYDIHHNVQYDESLLLFRRIKNEYKY